MVFPSVAFQVVSFVNGISAFAIVWVTGHLFEVLLVFVFNGSFHNCLDFVSDRLYIGSIITSVSLNSTSLSSQKRLGLSC